MDDNGAGDIAMAANGRKPIETMMSPQQSGSRTVAKTETEAVEQWPDSDLRDRTADREREKRQPSVHGRWFWRPHRRRPNRYAEVEGQRRRIDRRRYAMTMGSRRNVRLTKTMGTTTLTELELAVAEKKVQSIEMKAQDKRMESNRKTHTQRRSSARC